MTNDTHKSDTGLTEQLVSLIQARQIIDEDLHACTYFVLDAIVNAIAGMHTPMGKIIMDWWHATGNADAGRQSLLGGALTHTMEMDDLHKQSVTHPGCVVVPAAIAIAAREGLSGKEMLIAVLRGYESMCRVGNAVGRSHYKIWHSTATCGPFGSAIAAGSLLGLSKEQLVWALGNAGTQSAGVWEFMNSGGMSKHLHAGRAAEAGILAADLARHGFTGPTRILEGKQGLFAASCPDAQASAITAMPQGPWQLVQTSIKPWPCCRHTHPAIDAALEIAAQLRTPVRQATLKTYQAALDVCNRPDPDSEYQAKFSLQHCVAVALDRGRVDFTSFDSAARDSSASTRATVSVALSPESDKAYPHNWGCELEVTTVDGQVLRAKRVHCKGDPELPLDDNAMLAKARTLLDYAGVEAKQQQALLNYILNIQDQPRIPDVSGFLSFKF